MSDGCYDGWAHSQECERYENFLKTLAFYLKKCEKDSDTEKDLQDLVHAMQRTETVIKAEDIDSLTVNDHETWFKLFAEMIRKNVCKYVYKELKSLTPFKDSLIIVADYGMDCLRVPVYDVEEFVAKAVKIKGLKIGDCDKYLVVLQEANPEHAYVEWIDNSNGTKGPRKEESNERRTD